MNKIVKLTLILFLVCAIVAGILGGINELTKGPITEQKAIKTAKAYAAVLASDGYEPVDSAKYSEDPTIDAVEKASNGAATLCRPLSPELRAPSPWLSALTTTTSARNLHHLPLLDLRPRRDRASSSERGEQFRDSFIGQADTITVDDIDALTGATITSKAVADAVANAINVVESLG